MSNKPGEFIWYELMTADPDAAKRFYDSVVGWTVEPRPSGPIDYRMVDTGQGLVGGVMRLDEQMRKNGARPAWLGYLGVEDVDAVAERVRAAGGSVHVPPTEIPDVGRFALLADPQGAPFYVMHGASDGTSTAFSPETPGHVAWNELATPDLDGALGFYAEQFGITEGGRMPMGEMGDYVFLHHGDRPIGATMKRQPDAHPSPWTFYFHVADLDRSTDAVRAGGGQVLHGPTPVPGGSRIIVALDPEGAIFGLVSPDQGASA